MGIFYTIVLVFVILVLISFSVTWAIVIQEPPELPPPVQTTKSGLNMTCVLGDKNTCSEGLSCVDYGTGLYGVCKTSLGQPCTTLNQCTPSAIVCNGVCSSS